MKIEREALKRESDDASLSRLDSVEHEIAEIREQCDALQLDRRTDGNHPDDSRRSAHPQHVEALFSGLLEPNGFDRVVDPSRSHFDDRLNRIDLARIDGVRCAKYPGEFQLVGDAINGDDSLCPRDPRTLNRIQPNATTSDDGNRIPWTHLGRILHRTDARHNEHHALGKTVELEADIDVEAADRCPMEVRYPCLAMGENQSEQKCDNHRSHRDGGGEVRGAFETQLDRGRCGEREDQE